MPNLRLHVPFSPVSIAAFSVGTLVVVYLALIAVVMSYAALTIEFTQSIRNDEAQVAMLEAQYLASVQKVIGTDYAALGYSKPIAESFVRARSSTALR